MIKKGVNIMKTKKIFKIFTIITMLMLAIFTTGCESQQEKYTKACNEMALYERQALEENFTKASKAEKTNNKKIMLETAEEMFKNFETYEKTMREKLENLQKIAKGNPELEKDVRLKWEEFNIRMNSIVQLKTELKNELETEREKMKK